MPITTNLGQGYTATSFENTTEAQDKIIDAVIKLADGISYMDFCVALECSKYRVLTEYVTKPQ